MSEEIIPQVFDSKEFGSIRAMRGEDGEPWFVASDIAKALGYGDATHMTRRLDDDEKGLRSVETLGGKQLMAVITEAGMYSAILGSKVEGAKRFKRWITHEVIPAIRRDGGYMVAKDETPEETMARAVLIANSTIERQKARIAEMEPKAFFADSVSQSSTSVLVGVLAKLLKQNGYDTGQNRLFKTLCADGFLIGTKGRNYHMPTQKAIEMQLFEVKESTRTHADGHTSIDRTTLVTGKGQVYFVNRYCKESR